VAQTLLQLQRFREVIYFVGSGRLRMTVSEITDRRPAVCDVSVPNQTSMTERIRQIWPSCVVGLGLVATVVWVGLLGWVLYRALLALA
jgi:hypothetical protein